MVVGGLSQTHKADPAIKNLVNIVKKNVEEKLGRSYNKFEPISYRMQVVAGTNYFVKVQTDDQVIHTKIFVSLDQETKLTSLEENKSMSDDISYFP
eukprot:gene629-780_t